VADLRNNLGILLGCIILFIVALNAEEVGNSTIDSMIWPKVVLLLLMVLSLSSVISAFNTIRKKRLQSEPKIKNQPLKLTKGVMMGFTPIITAFVYVWAMQYLGYFLATLIIIPILMYLLGETRIVRLVSTPVIFMFSIWIVFVKLALLMLPMGSGIFREFSQFIMFGS
jgi:hypothetical protein